MAAEDMEFLEARFGAIQAAARRYAFAGEDPDDLASEIVMQATRLERPRPALADNHLKARVIDARRTLYGRDTETHTEARDVAMCEAQAEDPSPLQDDPEMAAWLLQTVDTGEPLRRDKEARVALGGLPRTRAEWLASLEETNADWGDLSTHRTRAHLIERKRLRKESTT